MRVKKLLVIAVLALLFLGTIVLAAFADRLSGPGAIALHRALFGNGRASIGLPLIGLAVLLLLGLLGFRGRNGK